MGPGPASLLLPVSLLDTFRTSWDSQYLTLMTGRGPYTGGRRHPSPSPVSLLDIPDAENGRHVSAQNTRNVKKGEKTLG